MIHMCFLHRTVDGNGVIQFGRSKKQEQKHRDARVSALLWIVLHMQAWLIQRKYLEGCLGIQVEPDC